MTTTATQDERDIARNARDYARIEAAILYLEAHFRDQPSLDRVADAAGLSPTTSNAWFRRWAGISPKRFGQYLSLDYARRSSPPRPLSSMAAFDTGLSGPARLHDLFVTYEAMSPGAFKRGGEGVDIAWGMHPSPFGPCFVGLTARGICALGFADGDGASTTDTVAAEFERRWPAARFREDRGTTAAIAARIFDPQQACREPLRLAPCGTNSSSRCGRRCYAFRPGGLPPIRRWPGRWGCRAARARSAAPSPPTRSPT